MSSLQTALWWPRWKEIQKREDICIHMGFPGGSDGKESACSAGDLGSIPGLGRSPGGGYGNLLQCSCLENPHGQRCLAGCSPWGYKALDTTGRLNKHSLYAYSWFPSLCSRNWHISVKQLCSNKEKKEGKKAAAVIKTSKDRRLKKEKEHLTGL